MNNPPPNFEGPVCPLPLAHHEQIMLGHGSGGRMTQELIARVFFPHLNSPALQAGNDFASLKLIAEAGLQGTLAVSTDSHIVTPLFFPGGDIGKLAVCGTVNDVSMSGAIPLYLTAGFILEEGLPVVILERVATSMEQAAAEAGIVFVAGDTKVAERGKVDGLFVNTTGIGWKPAGQPIGGAEAKPGDVVLISGTMGDHGIAVLQARGELGFETDIQSDVAPLNHLIQAILAAAPHVHVLRDPTRGGLATTLNEIAVQSQVSIWLEEEAIPVQPAVQAACEMLGFDPLYVANEGKVIVIVPEDESEAALEAMHSSSYGSMATRIGVVQADFSRKSAAAHTHWRNPYSRPANRRDAASNLLGFDYTYPNFFTLRGNMKIEYQETTSDLQTRIDIHGKYGARDIDQWMLDLLQIQPGIKILDVGCGSGKQCFSYFHYLKGEAEIHGGDVSKELLGQARENNAKIGNRVHFGELNFNQRFPYDDQQFDLVSCCFAIYYAENIPYTISEMHRVLKTGGRLFTTGPMPQNKQLFYDIIREATHKPIPPMPGSSRYSTEIYAAVEKLFSKVEVHIFENPLTFESVEPFLAYTQASLSEDRKLWSGLFEGKDDFNKVMDQIAKAAEKRMKEEGQLVMKKVVGGFLATK